MTDRGQHTTNIMSPDDARASNLPVKIAPIFQHDWSSYPASGPLTQKAFLTAQPLAQEWDDLAAQTGATPYARPGWIQAWWHSFGTGELEIHTLRRQGHLVAVLPLARQDTILQVPTNCHTPDFCMLAEDLDSTAELAQILFAAKPQGVIIAPLGSEDDTLSACRHAAKEAGYRISMHPYQHSPYLDISGSWSEYESKLSKKLTASLRRCRRHLDDLGTVSVEIADGSSELEGLLQEVFTLEASGWKGRNHTAIKSNIDTRDFYTNIAHWATAQSILRIFILRLDRQPLAMFFALVDQRACYLLKTGYDPAYAQFSPGKLLASAVIFHCYSTQLSRIEFQGDADQYKFDWTSSIHSQERFEAYSRTPGGLIMWAAFNYGKPIVNRISGLIHTM